MFDDRYEYEKMPILFQCTECGKYDLSLGKIHAHIEKHRGYTRFGIQLPFTKTSVGDFERLMGKTNVYRPDNLSEIPLSVVNEDA